MLDLFSEIWQTLRTNKLRTALTGLAVSWGIFMLIILVGLAQGVINSFGSSSIANTNNIVQIWGGNASMAYDGLKAGRYVPLKRGNMDAIAKENPDNVATVFAQVYAGSSTISTDRDYVTSSYTGVFPESQRRDNITIKEGRFINAMDLEEKRKVIVLDGRTVDQLFADRNSVIGNFVKVGDLSFKVIGFYDSDWRRDIYVPYTTAWALSGFNDNLSTIMVETKGLKTEEDADKLDSDLYATLGKANRHSADDHGAVWLWNRFSNYLSSLKAQNILNLTMWVIGLLTLITGIVGVSNIMFVSVRERTHEIGIRRAIGAKPRSILMQVILESVVLTAVFGYLGIILGTIGTEILAHYFADSEAIKDPKVNLALALQVMCVLVISGALAGIFPAFRALKIRPVEALRTE
ncbi:MAG: ABC transporter permease [Muribaculum sp.]|nr:ABC transporter permease [Muribaculum sp.]